MKRQLSILAAVVIFSLVTLLGCSTSVDTKITLNNLAQGAVYLNFRAEVYSVAPGKTLEINDVPKGSYEYEITFSIPAGATEGNVNGEGAGELNIEAGTKVLFLFSSNLANNSYTLNVSMTTTNDLTPEPTSP